MLDIFLTDVQEKVIFNDYPSDHPVKFVLNFKKIFPSTAELLLPVLPEDSDLEQVTWESTTADFEIFKKLLSSWGVIELRLSAITSYKDKPFADDLVKRAQAKRKQVMQSHSQYSLLILDYVFMNEIHALLDAELFNIGEKFYLPILREQWKNEIPELVLLGRI